MYQKMTNQKPIKFLVIGRTASGKSTIVKKVCEELGLKQVKSLTTRPARPGEVNNPECDHYFVSDDEFQMIINQKGCAAYTEINGFKYATTFEELNNSDIYVIDPNGVDSLKFACGDRYKFVEIYVRVPYATAKKRYMERGGTAVGFKERYDKESDQFKKYENDQAFDYHILNDGSIEESVEMMCRYIKYEEITNKCDLINNNE